MNLLSLAAVPAAVASVRASPGAHDVKPCFVQRRAACLTLLAAFTASPALAYGGGANLRQTDAGEGNPRYEALVQTLREEGRTPSRMKEELLVQRCRTGKEAACK